MNKTVVETRQLQKRYGAVAALDGIDIAIEKGEFVAIMGPSGCGKSTLLNILSCLDTLSAGELLLEGVNATALNDDQRRIFRAEKIGLVFQQFHLIPYLTALENVMLAQYYHSVVDHQAATEVLTQVGLTGRMTHLPSQLSGGEQQRVCVARALINEPPLIFADEPTGNLDEENERLVLALLQHLHREGRTIVMVTHNPDLGKMADRIIRLHHGKLVDGTVHHAIN